MRSLAQKPTGDAGRLQGVRACQVSVGGTAHASTRSMRALSLVLGVAAACGAPSAPELPWLYGLSGTVATDEGLTELADRLVPPEGGEDDCAVGARFGFRIVADVVGSQAQETIVASFARGIAVFDREEQVLTTAGGYPCTGGSADGLASLAVGRAYGVPTIVLAATEGGRNISITWLGLWRISDGKLVPVFTGVVEERTGNQVKRGALYLLPGALVYRRPGGPWTLWVYDDAAGAYLFREAEGTDEPVEPRHVPIVGAR
jgi:hypothetical protein